MFPPEVGDTLDVQETAEIPAGGRVGVGFVCNGDGADLVYAGVLDAPDGVYAATADGLSGPIAFTTGSPDPGRGVGALQGTFDQSEYRFDFGDLDVQVTVEGCGS